VKKILLIIALSSPAAPPTSTRKSGETRRAGTSSPTGSPLPDYCDAQPWAQASCAELAAQHDAAARASVDEIRAMAAQMDGMAALASRGLADGSCIGDALLAELDRHAVAGCAGSADTEVEAQRHCTTVLDLAAQMHLRSDVALQSMTATYYSGSGSNAAALGVVLFAYRYGRPSVAPHAWTSTVTCARSSNAWSNAR
jgi:hypothetical protein